MLAGVEDRGRLPRPRLGDGGHRRRLAGDEHESHATPAGTARPPPGRTDPHAAARKRLGCDNSYVTLLVGALEQRGLAVRQQHPTDRRIKVIVLTGKGRELTKRAQLPFGVSQPRVLPARRSSRNATVRLPRTPQWAVRPGADSALGALSRREMPLRIPREGTARARDGVTPTGPTRTVLPASRSSRPHPHTTPSGLLMPPFPRRTPLCPASSRTRRRCSASCCRGSTRTGSRRSSTTSRSACPPGTWSGAEGGSSRGW
ncbi:MarR family transcriptional regulator [Streptomyces sp. NPDC087270]|uniref:MarR family transcriptional regulator n=1 Tax=Streptomyces sp. NPDC087270 TaxID=3365774 RepID=UPI003827254F